MEQAEEMGIHRTHTAPWTAKRWSALYLQRDVFPEKPATIHRALRVSAVNPHSDAQLFLIFLENETTVGTAEAEAVGQRIVDLHRTRLVRHIIEVAACVRIVVVDGRGRGASVWELPRGLVFAAGPAAVVVPAPRL